MTTTTNAPWIPEVVANVSIGALGNYLNLGRTVDHDTDLTPVRHGQTISIPRRGVVTATQKSESSDSVTQQPTADEVSVTVDQHWYVKIAEEDYTNSFQIGSTLPGYLEDGVIALAEKIESRLLTHVSEFGNIDAGSSAGDAYDGVVDVRKKLIESKVPTLLQKYGYISPRFYARLLKEEAILDPKVSSGEISRITGVVGSTAGIALFEGQLTPTSGSPAWDQNFFYTRHALVLASRPLQMPGRELGVDGSTVMSEHGIALRLVRYYDPVKMAVTIQVDTLFGTAVNDSRQAYVLESQ